MRGRICPSDQSKVTEAIALGHIGRHQIRLGDCRETALAHGRQALAGRGDLGHQRPGLHLAQLDYIRHHLGRYGQAIDLVHETDDRFHEVTSLTDLGETHHAAADPGTAPHAWTQALTITDEISLLSTAPLCAKILHSLDRHPDDAFTSPARNGQPFVYLGMTPV
jgi:hypothetical protein